MTTTSTTARITQIAAVAVVTACAAAAVLHPFDTSADEAGLARGTTTIQTAPADQRGSVDLLRSPRTESSPVVGEDPENTAHRAYLSGVKLSGERVLATETLARLRSTYGRDLMSTKTGAIGAPASIDLSAYTVTPQNQGQHGSCVGWAVGYGMTGWFAKKAGVSDPHFAAYYIYSQVNGGRDVGSWPTEALDVLVSQGIAKIADYPQQARDDIYTKPDATERAKALPFKMTGKRQLFSGSNGQGQAAIDVLKAALAGGRPVPISINVRPGFSNHWQTDAADNDSTSAYDRDAAGNIAGHEILAIGYDATGLRIQNSWGTAYGSGGFTTLGWNVVGADVTSAFTVDGFAVNPVNNTNNDTTTTDTMAPVVTTPTSTPQLHSTIAADGTTRHVVAFSAKDADGIARTQVDVSVDGGAWTVVSLPTTTATSVVMDLAPGHTYRFAAAAKDGTGRWSSWATGSAFRVTAYSETSARYSTGWRYAAWTEAVGQQLAVTSQAGATVSFTYTGKAVAVIASRANNRGTATVYVDGVNKGALNLYSVTTYGRSVALTVNNGSTGTHTVTLVVAGSQPVDVDHFIVTS